MPSFLKIPKKISDGLLVIQGTNFCNLNCKYCYVPNRKNKDRLEPDLFEDFIKKVFSSNLYYGSLNILWHAGEPLVLGVSYYEKLISIVKKNCPDEVEPIYHIQTNATLINDKWIAFFKKNKVNVGVSIDGPQFLHDENRVGWNNKGSFNQTLRGLKLIQENDISYTVLCVLTANSLKHPNEIYQFFKEQEVNYIGFNIEEIEGDHYETSIIDELQDKIASTFSNFIEQIYDLCEADNRRIAIREINQTLTQMQRLNNKNAESAGPISQELIPFAVVTLTSSGDVILFSPELASGTSFERKKFVIANIENIHELKSLVKLEKFKKIFKQINRGVLKCHQECHYFSICGGGSPSNKYYENGTFDCTETLYCKLRKKIMTEVILTKLENL